MAPTQRRILKLRVVYIAVIAAVILCLGARFTVRAQQAAVMPVITVEDAKQDERIDGLREFRTQQEGFNREQDRKIDEQNRNVDEIRQEIATVRGIGVGAVSVLGALQIVSVLLQLRRKQPA